MSAQRKVIFADLDRILPHPITRSAEEALDALKLWREKEIGVIFCSAKMRAEQEIYRGKLNRVQKEVGLEIMSRGRDRA